MGLYDDVELAEEVRLPEWEYDQVPSELRWRSKDIEQPARTTYRVTADGRLYERQRDAELDFSGEHPTREIHDEWWEQRREFTRTFTISTMIDEETVQYELRFLSGSVNRIIRIQ